MTFLSKLLTLTGTIFLSHAVYSTHELSLLTTLPRTGSSSSSSSSSPFSSSSYSSTKSSSISLPADLILELLISACVLVLGLVLGCEPLKPISWSVWAGSVEHDERLIKNEARVEKEVLGQGKEGRNGRGMRGHHPFDGLEDGKRVGFWAVRAARKDFADWIRSSSTKKQ